MKLTSSEALKLLENAKEKTSNDGWIYHSICVGNTAAKIAQALNLDIELERTLGYIHDIGKSFKYEHNWVFSHAVYGYKYIKELGYDEEYAGICIF